MSEVTCNSNSGKDQRTEKRLHEQTISIDRIFGTNQIYTVQLNYYFHNTEKKK